MAGTGWNEVGTDFGRSRPRFLNQLGGAEPPQFQPRGAQKQPKLVQIGQNGGLKVPVVPHGWNRVERSWNGLWEVQAKVFEPIWRSGTPPISAQGCPKTAQIGPDWPKWRFEGSGGPKRLEQCGTKLERALGGPGQGF